MIKVPFHFSFEIEVDLLISIEMFQSTKESWQIVSLIIRRFISFVLINDIHEDSHDDWKNSNTHQQAKSDEETLPIRTWIEVSKPDGGQRGEWEVAKNDHGVHAPSTFWWDIVEVSKMLWLFKSYFIKVVPSKKFVLNLTQNLEAHCKVVATANDNYDDLDELERKWDRHNGPDTGIVYFNVFSISIFVILDFLLHCLRFLLPKQLEVAHNV